MNRAEWGLALLRPVRTIGANMVKMLAGYLEEEDVLRYCKALEKGGCYKAFEDSPPRVKCRDVSQEQLAKGILVEREHTLSNVVATKIALDHLAECPDYYSRLERLEGRTILDHNWSLHLTYGNFDLLHLFRWRRRGRGPGSNPLSWLHRSILFCSAFQFGPGRYSAFRLERRL